MNKATASQKGEQNKIPGGEKNDDLARCLIHLSQATFRSGDECFGFDLSR